MTSLTKSLRNALSSVSSCFSSKEIGKYSLNAINSKSNTSLEAKLSLLHSVLPQFGEDIDPLKFQVTYETPTRIHVKITDLAEKRWQIPNDIVPLNNTPSSDVKGLESCQYRFQYTDSPFGFSVERKTGEKLFDTNGLGLVFKDQYMELSTHLPKHANIYGLGETNARFRREEGSLTTIWSRDTPCPEDENAYGCHPFYMEIRDGKAHGVLLFNSNGMDIKLSEDNSQLTYRVIGGVLDLYIFVGDTPQLVVQQYQELIGLPAMLPYWSLGFHQCRWGYNTLDIAKKVVEDYKKAEIPLECMWIDIDYMDKYKSFTFDPVRYPPAKLKDFLKDLHSRNQKMIMIVDPGIKVEKGNMPYEVGMERDIFIKRADGEIFIGRVWPGKTAFPDWFNPQTDKYWAELFHEWFDTLPLDGVWLDMNEIANFADGDCTDHPDDNNPMIPTEGQNVETMVQQAGTSEFTNENAEEEGFEEILKAENVPIDKDVQPELNTDEPIGILNPPYKINNGGTHEPLHTRTSPMDAKHHGGINEYDVHNLFGHMESLSSYKAYKKYYPERKPFLLSRSTFVGSGAFAYHWLGDNWSNWEHLRYSIPGMLNFQLFGIPMVGPDIGGFNDPSEEELLIRWHQLGSFYPFARNHNGVNHPGQEPYVYPSLAETSKKYLNIRYEMLPLWYTLFWRSSTRGDTVVRGLCMEYPEDTETLGNESQFLLGDSVLVTPVLEKGARDVKGYFPRGKWYDYYTGEVVAENSASGKYLTLDAPLDFMPIHLRGGCVLPLQRPSMTTDESRQNPFKLIVSLDEHQSARGELYLDDDKPLNAAQSTHIQFNLENGALSTSGRYEYQVSDRVSIEEIQVFGVLKTVQKIEVEGKDLPADQYQYEEKSQSLKISNISLPLNQDWKLVFTH
ncbi:hypothetical protein K493DRAFT_252149 [Basidiobolus meristosporus CBS 931.73]|uniref:alpha-glucosidase n=1 Tax=Basidiobolus meristosporus CBS 931.73 TaxID=1314790 RepID=A0A1Y1Z7H0_9FUNG|nr:hypothetical protein K493DRAFT_252149 [Basidiobolus meristosporus CBS 931.73]|eukprot:ORY06191.1 hypothetical protein K493DRAFT_252149 [Basidiobolus meristosporus CBS 931.73]